MSYADKISKMVGAPTKPKRTREQNSRTGRRNREKGKEFERHVAANMDMILCDPRFNGTLVIRRSSQAERAYEADLIIEAQNAPDWLLNIWVECENSKAPDPKAKMEQAIRDAATATLRTGRQRTPVVCWREAGTRCLWLSTYVSWLDELLGGTIPPALHPGHGLLVTSRLDDVLRRLRARL